jgi:hypothetical protein
MKVAVIKMEIVWGDWFVKKIVHQKLQVQEPPNAAFDHTRTTTITSLIIVMVEVIVAQITNQANTNTMRNVDSVKQIAILMMTA